MPLSTDITLYNDVRNMADQALTSEKGVQCRFVTRGQAVYMRHRFYTFRTLARKQALEQHDPGSNDYGIGPYDNISANLIEGVGEWVLQLIKQPDMEIEEIK